MANVANAPQATSITTSARPVAGARLSPRAVLIYDLVILAILVVIAVWYLNDATLGGLFGKAQSLQPGSPAPAPAPAPNPAAVGTSTFDLRKNLDLALQAMWFGALGGVVISLKSVFDHTAFTKDWDPDFGLWHLGRPYTGAIAGLMTVILLAAAGVSGAVANTAVVLAVAFIFGTQETRFFNFLSEVAKLVVQVPSEAKRSLAAAAIEPPTAAAGALVLIRGTSFEKPATAKIAGVALDKQAVAADGTLIAGLVPARPAAVAVNAPVDVTVTQGPLTVTLVGAFRYSA